MDERVLQIVLRARDEASKTLRNVENSTNGLTKAFKANFNQAALMSGAVLSGFVALGTMAANNAGELEKLQVALQTVTGSVEKAEQAMKVIRKTAADSPFFETRTLARFVQLMAASGQEINTAVKSSLAFGDVAAAFGKGNEEMERMGVTLSQVIGKGSANIIDFRELVNAGWVSVRKDVAETMGVTMAEFEEMVSAGEVGYDQIRQAAEKFNGSAQKQSGTWQALLQRMNESFNNFLADLIVDTGLFDSLKAGLITVIALMDEWGPRIGAVVEKLLQNKEVIFAIAGAITGLLVLAIGALVVAFGPALLIMGAFIALGAGIGLIIYKLIEIFNVWGPVVQGVITSIKQRFDELASKVQDIINRVSGAINSLPNILRSALNFMFDMVKNFNPIIRIGLELPDIASAFNNLKTSARKIGIPGFAEGTNFAPGGLAVVGERGPELINLPRGSQVFSNRDSQQMVGGGGPALHIDQVIVRDSTDIDSLAHRLAFAYKTRGNL